MIGVDEVGRGAWAGPLLVCAARINQPMNGLKDSKVLSPKKRQALAQQIARNADVGYGWVSADEIDDIGLAAALRLATARALEEITIMPGESIIIDGTVNFAPDTGAVTKIKADQTEPAVSAASIAAKVARDTYMQEIAEQYPEYGFALHVGYGTQKHREAIEQHGYCSLHRRSFRLPKPKDSIVY